MYGPNHSVMKSRAKQTDPMPAENQPEKRKLITFEPPDYFRHHSEAAEKATGTDRSKLIVEAIRTDLPKVVQKILDERQRAAEAFFRLSGDNPSQSIAFSSETSPAYRPGGRKTKSS